MSVFTEGPHVGEFLISEMPNTGSRDQVVVTVPASTTLRSGFVLSKLTATGKHVPYDNNGSDGSETASAILYTEHVNDTVSPVDVDATVINRNAEVKLDALLWDDEENDGAAGLVDLLTVGIKARA
jgi:hypothetical protein